MATYEILIADDHPLFRSALHQAVSLGLGSDVRLVEVASIAELEAQLAVKADWDLVLLDLNMPGAYGFSGLVLLRGQYPQIPVVMVSAQEEASIMVRSREFGASGFIPKSSSLEDIQKAVRAVLDGDVSWPPQAFEDVQVLRLQRVEAGAHHAADGLLKGLAEAPGVQLRDKKLGNVFRQVHLAIAPAGHIQLGQRVGAHIGKAQRLQQTGKCLAAAW